MKKQREVENLGYSRDPVRFDCSLGYEYWYVSRNSSFKMLILTFRLFRWGYKSCSPFWSSSWQRRFRFRKFLSKANQKIWNHFPYDLAQVIHGAELKDLKVQCSRSGLTVHIKFDSPFDGIVYSQNYYQVPQCTYVTSEMSSSNSKDRTSFR